MTISDKLDYISMGKLNKEQMEYICEINQEVNMKNREIERLKELSKTDYETSQEILYEKSQEIERLNKDLDTSIDICNKRQVEIVRLTNIINELEKWLKEVDFEDYDLAPYEVLNKIKELKQADINVGEIGE